MVLLGAWDHDPMVGLHTLKINVLTQVKNQLPYLTFTAILIWVSSLSSNL